MVLGLSIAGMYMYTCIYQNSISSYTSWSEMMTSSLIFTVLFSPGLVRKMK